MLRGFTLIEMIVVMAIGAVLITATTVNLLGGQRRVVKLAGVEQLVADIRAEQVKAMTGAGAGVVDLAAVDLDNSLTISSSYPGNTITFAPLSGETAAGTVTVTDDTDQTTRTLHINKYGVVTAVD
ncbi:MAG: hypothetical protein UX99_C0007G0019 [Candidatus Amesbacteria bacterium GW2011_GWB1_47_26]|uniref:Prepilin-type N-terminal cleavage/methylation domain-containing protein n=1 Tax=Candidatus Amesbacteria bacterium GW2011_GWC2_45_19 TaxID=1618366 RepID=A0A0G1PAU9_9BACT|nr:MAG: hypothetical protein UX05_C0012G0005 [Candidatus Amesbacteria bacterium GW2011_GWC2_45_19]KKU38072.1 MAG: hypothetical protein UX52_C0011G0002 [Candidatus Amesbacteria bacterium GW2011_GWA1_46_35]KKU69045.1 MAG: hypothetical protein UX93_C0003G0037 [Microgenomates group bacterium GW2011_GWC1_47_20]KKU74731.1 MAG: hypothetical protein UX99_C0007G0019 [Candidatus Amesbacteria bacterium GW2011_GWB1_47_26]